MARSSPLFLKKEVVKMATVPIPIVLYQNTVPLNNARRTFTNPLSISGTPREDLDPLHPEILVEYNAAIMLYNYAYIAEYGRYYSFDKLPTVEGKKLRLSLKADTFWNWKNVIMRSECIAERSSSAGDLMVEDSAVIGVAGYTYFSRSLPYTFQPDNGTYVLMVAGGQ